MRTFLLALFLFTVQLSKAQDRVEQLADKVCDCINKDKTLMDTLKLQYCFLNVLSDTMVSFKTDTAFFELANNVELRVAKRCPAFVRFAEKADAMKGNWIRLEAPVESKLDSKTCHDLLKQTNFYYLEKNGDTTTLLLKDNIWMDQFLGGTYYSKLHFRWTGDCDFELEFIETNEPLRKGYSKKDDKYACRIIDKTETYYLMTISYPPFTYQYRLYISQ